MLKVIALVVCIAAAVHAAPKEAYNNLVWQDDLTDADDYFHSTPIGDLLGLKKSSTLLSSYYAFKGIPYAEAPVGSLRFRNPVPHPGWSDVLDARKHGSSCVQPGTLLGYSGSEDCLFLNVYSPNLSGKRAVMVFIHGGSFTGGDGSTSYYGPEPLINEDVVLVTINYRLGLLGFLSTGDRNAQGNYGVKDAIEALRWVQKNIAAFGGDPDRVTIFGESAGSVMVHALVLSPLARGLFARAISQSGTLLSPWAFATDPRSVAFEVGRALGIQTTNTFELVANLRGIEDVGRFAKITEGWTDLPVPRGQSPFQFAPSAEPIDSPEPRALIEPPLATMQKGTFNQVPYIIGSNSDEALYGVRELIIDPTLFTKFNRNPHYYIPTSWNVDPVSPAANEIITNVRNTYFDGEDVDDKYQYTQFCSDTHFHYGTYKTVKLHSSKQVAPVYYYVFGFDGDLNLVKTLLLLFSYPGAMHADDIPYLFRLLGFPAPILPGTNTYTVRARMTQMWTNFAKQADPTPKVTSTLTTKWDRVRDNMEYMSITRDLTMGSHPFEARMKMWEAMDRKYGNF